MALRVKATDQLNGLIESVNAIAESKLDVWDGTQWKEEITRNPAWIYTDILRGSANGKPVSDGRIDLQRIKQWADACNSAPPQNNLPGGVTARIDEKRSTCDLVVDWSTTVWELLNQVASIGRATPGMVDGKFSVVRDVEQTVPVQIFTPRNSWGFKGRKTFVQQPHAFRVRYVEPAKEWEQEELFVFADGENEETATRFEELELLGVTRRDQAWREGRYHMAVAAHRPESFELFIDVENIVCTRGDLVEVAHDVPRLGGEWTRVTAIGLSGSDVDSLTFDEPVVMEAGKTYVVRARRSDGDAVTVSLQTVAGEQETVSLAIPVPQSQAPAVGDLAVMGEADTVTASMIVKSLEPGPDLSAKLVLLDAAPEVHLADQGAIPAYEPRLYYDPETSPPPAVAVTMSGESVRHGNRAQHNILVAWSLPTGAFAAGYEIYRRDDSGAWVLEAVQPTAAYAFENVARGRTLEVAVLAVATNGAKRTVSQAGSASYTMIVPPPPDVADFAILVATSGDTASATWAAGGSDLIRNYVVRWCSDTSGTVEWGGMVPLGASVSHPGTSVSLPAMSGTYAIKAVDFDGVESVNAARVVTTVPGALGINLVEQVDEAPGFAGGHAGTAVIDGKLLLESADTLAEWTSLGAVVNLALGVGGFTATGTYDFANVVDLGASYVSRVTLDLAVAGNNFRTTLADWTRLDQVERLDGAAPSTWGARLEISTTGDDPAGSPTWSAWNGFTVGNYAARAFRFRLILTSNNTGVTPEVTALSVTVDMPDRIERASAVASPAAGKSVTYSTPFRTVPTVGVTGLDMATGDYFVITGESEQGFTVGFKDSNGDGVARTFNWTAVGFGAVIT